METNVADDGDLLDLDICTQCYLCVENVTWKTHATDENFYTMWAQALPTICCLELLSINQRKWSNSKSLQCQMLQIIWALGITTQSVLNTN